MKAKNQDFLKKENLILVLKMISTHGPISRAEIAKRAKMSPTSASRIVAELSNKKLVEEVEVQQSNVGRKANYFILNREGFYFAGVELDSSYIRVGLMNFNEELIFKRTDQITHSSPEYLVEQIVNRISDLMKDYEITNDQMLGLCVGLPGIVDPDTGIIKFSVQLQWENYPLAEILNNQLDIPVRVDNELKLKALSEYETYGGNVESLLLLGFGSGVGSALITNGKIARGGTNFAGEIGHTVVDPNGTYCPCGNFGCLQTYIAEPFLLNEASKTKQINSLGNLINEAQNGQIWAYNLISKAVKYAAIAINNTVCSYNPDLVVLSGSIIENHPYFRDELLKTYSSTIWSPVKDSFKVEITNTEDEGVVFGAAIHMKDQFIENINL